MQTKKLFVVALSAATALVSCERTDVSSNILDEGTLMDVALKISGTTVASRAIGSDLGSSITPELSDGTVFFYNEATGYIWGSEDIDPDVITVDDGQIFEQVSSKADMVYIVANIPSSVKSSITSNTTIDDLKSVLADISTQSSLSATAVLLANILDDDKADYDAVIKEDGDNYKAMVLISPSMSRVQFADISTSDASITSYEVAGVYIDNYHESYNPSTTSTISSDPLTVGTDGTLLGTLTSQPYDEPTGAVSATSGKVSASDFDSTGDIFGYNLTPSSSEVSSGEYTPAIIIKLTNIAYTDAEGNAQTMDTGYITVARYMGSDDEITSFESGNIYNIPSGSFVFDLSDITDEPNQPDVELTVFAEVCPWTINTVTPYL